jgi:hypothetical protein
MYVPEQQGKQKVNRVVSNMLPILSPNDLTINIHQALVFTLTCQDSTHALIDQKKDGVE